MPFGCGRKVSEDQPVDDAPRPRRRQGRFRRCEILTFCFSNPAAAHWPRLRDKKPISWQPWRCYLSPPSHHAGIALLSSPWSLVGVSGKNLSCDPFLIPDPGCRTTRPASKRHTKAGSPGQAMREGVAFRGQSGCADARRSARRQRSRPASGPGPDLFSSQVPTRASRASSCGSAQLGGRMNVPVWERWKPKRSFGEAAAAASRSMSRWTRARTRQR
ncbi:hypothetical protein B0T18DRAFT_148819 [Schizothecium vesticola]|uniref:Uncharacterized protein n=1 Tax=Schizothecium vesticola TaxID=314040 RepID=A0AA40K547_9PEZI|nr:hypothetical protein B0T18DRAFT_148819 [Schizothecium vesticola]